MSKSGEVLSIETEKPKTEVAIGDVSELVLHGPVSLTTPALGALLREEIPVTWLRPAAGCSATPSRPAIATWRSVSRNTAPPSTSGAASPLPAGSSRQRFATPRLPAAKLQGGRRGGARCDVEALARLADGRARADRVELLGIEGEAAARYFRLFATMFGEAARDFPEFAFDKRTRRPPADPINAMLSLAYALLRALGSPCCRRRLRSLSRLLSPAALRPACARARHDGAIPADARGLRP